MALDALVLEKPTNAPETLAESTHEKAKIIATAGISFALLASIGLYLHKNDLPGIDQLFTFLNPPAPQGEIQAASPATEGKATQIIDHAALYEIWPGKKLNPEVAQEEDWAAGIAFYVPLTDDKTLTDFKDNARTIPWTEISKRNAKQHIYNAVMHLRSIGVDPDYIQKHMFTLTTIIMTDRQESFFLPSRIELGYNPAIPEDTSTIPHEIYHRFFEVDIAGLNEGFAAWQEMDTGYSPNHGQVACGSGPEKFDYSTAAVNMEEIATKLEQPGQPGLAKTMIYIYRNWLKEAPNRDIGDYMSSQYFFTQIDETYHLKPGAAKSLFFSKKALRCGQPTATPEPSRPPKIPPKGKTPTPAQQRPK